MDLVTPFMNNERPSSRSGGIVEGAVGEDVQRIGHEEVCSTEMEIAKGTGNCEGILSFRCRRAFLGKRQGSPQKQRGQRTPPSPKFTPKLSVLLAENGRRNRLHVVVNHVDIGRGRAIGGGKRIGIERAANL